MSTIEQMQDNLSYMKDFRPLNEDEYQTIKKAQDALDAQDLIKCTGCLSCGQCEEACPQSLPIMSLLEECRDL